MERNVIMLRIESFQVNVNDSGYELKASGAPGALISGRFGKSQSKRGPDPGKN
jgi:hypothetical protein